MNKLPKGFKHIGEPNCSSCCFVQKKLITKSAYCMKHFLTFFLYESAKYYSCEDHQPIRGEWNSDKTEIKEE